MAAKRTFVRIQKMRYRMSSIKRYEPFYREDIKQNPYGVYVFFSMTGNSNKIYHMFETEEERDLLLIQLDQAFGIE